MFINLETAESKSIFKDLFHRLFYTVNQTFILSLKLMGSHLLIASLPRERFVCSYTWCSLITLPSCPQSGVNTLNDTKIPATRSMHHGKIKNQKSSSDALTTCHRSISVRRNLTVTLLLKCNILYINTKILFCEILIYFQRMHINKIRNCFFHLF